MRKFNRLFCMLSMAALVVFASCNKKNETASFTIGLTPVQGLQMDDSKAYIDIYDGCQMKWNEGDKIMVYNLAEDYTNSVACEYTAAAGCEGQTSTTFSGEPVGERQDIGYFYFYPSYKASGQLQEDNRETFTVDRTQTYNETTIFDPTSLVMAIDVENLNDDLEMQHIFGFLNIKLTKATPARVKSIVVTDSHFHLAGQMSIKLPAVKAQKFSDLYDECVGNNPNYEEDLAEYLGNDFLGYMTSTTDEDYAITLDCSKADNGQGVLVNGTKKYFFFSLRPGALYKGFTVTINYMDETLEPTVLNYDADINYCIRPGWFKNLTIGI